MGVIGFKGVTGPTAEQFRFMCRVAGERPHIDRVKGLWRCVGRGFYGYGETWRAAFNAWMIQRACHEDFERRRQA